MLPPLTWLVLLCLGLVGGLTAIGILVVNHRDKDAADKFEKEHPGVNVEGND